MTFGFLELKKIDLVTSNLNLYTNTGPLTVLHNHPCHSQVTLPHTSIIQATNRNQAQTIHRNFCFDGKIYNSGILCGLSVSPPLPILLAVSPCFGKFYAIIPLLRFQVSCYSDASGQHLLHHFTAVTSSREPFQSLSPVIKYLLNPFATPRKQDRLWSCCRYSLQILSPYL